MLQLPMTTRSVTGPDPGIRHRTQIGMFRPIRMDHTNCLQVAIKTIQFQFDDQSSGDMDIADYRREAARIQKRRSVALGSREDVPTQESPCCRLRNKSHRAAVSRYRAAEEAGSTVGSQGLALGETRCVGLCTGSVAMVH
jgi:hypothetical protein